MNTSFQILTCSSLQIISPALLMIYESLPLKQLYQITKESTINRPTITKYWVCVAWQEVNCKMFHLVNFIGMKLSYIHHCWSKGIYISSKNVFFLSRCIPHILMLFCMREKYYLQFKAELYYPCHPFYIPLFYTFQAVHCWIWRRRIACESSKQTRKKDKYAGSDLIKNNSTLTP